MKKVEKVFSKINSHAIAKKIVQNIFTNFGLFCFGVTPIIYLLLLIRDIESFKVMKSKLFQNFIKIFFI